MLRIASCLAFFGAIWLASTAIPDTDGQRRMNQIIGISLASNPDAEALNTSVAEGKSSDAATMVTKDYVAAGRKAAAVFGVQPLRVAAFDDTDSKPTVAATRAILLNAVSSTPSKQAVAAKITPAEPEPVQMSRSERRALVRHIQRELRRVGCYDGSIDGVWGSGSRKGLTAFAKRISAPVPIAKPDYVALMLIETYSARACGTEPETILAHVEPQAVPTTTKVADAGLVTTVVLLPTPSPARFARNQIVVAKALSPQKPISRPGQRATPRVAGVRTRRFSSQSRATQRENRRVRVEKQETRRVALALASKRQADEQAREKNVETRRAKSRKARINRARRIASARQRAAKRARAKAQRRASLKRKRRTKRRARRRPTYGFKRSRRSWVRQAFTPKH